MCRHKYKASSISNNQGNTTLLKKINKALVTDPKEIEIYEMSDKKFQIIILKGFNELQESRISEAIHEHEKLKRENIF